MLGSILRFVFVIVLALVIFWPPWGLMWLGINYYADYPILVTVLALGLGIVVATFLPLTVRQFNVISTIGIVAIMGASLYKLWHDRADMFNMVPGFMWLVLVAAVAVGWLLVSTRLWRSAHGIVAVQQTTTVEEHHDQ